MIPSTQCEPCLFFMRLGAHDLITLSARRKEREEHLNCLYQNKTNRKTHTFIDHCSSFTWEQKEEHAAYMPTCVLVSVYIKVRVDSAHILEPNSPVSCCVCLEGPKIGYSSVASQLVHDSIQCRWTACWRQNTHKHILTHTSHGTTLSSLIRKLN